MKRSLLCSAVLFACTAISSTGYAESIVVENDPHKVIENGVIGSTADDIGLKVNNSTVTIVDDATISGKYDGLAAQNSHITIGHKDKSNNVTITTTDAIQKDNFGISLDSTDLVIYADKLEVNAPGKKAIWFANSSNAKVDVNQLDITGSKIGLGLTGNSTANVLANEINVVAGSHGIAAQRDSSLFVGSANSEVNKITITNTTNAVFATENGTLGMIVEELDIVSATRGISSQSSSSVSIGSLERPTGKIDITASKHGALATKGSVLNLMVGQLAITSDERGLESDSNAIISIGSLEHPTGKIDISAGEIGVYALESAQINMLTDELTIRSADGLYSAKSSTLTVGSLDRRAEKITITATKSGIVTSNAANLHLVANQTEIVSDQQGIFSRAGSILTISGNLSVKAPDVLVASQGTNNVTTIKINEDKASVVKLDGNINFRNSSDGNQVANADVTINLVGKDSFWNGTTVYSWDTDNQSGGSALIPQDMKLLLADGAQWTPTSEENLGDKTQVTSLNHLELDGGIINIKDEAIHTEVDKLKGTGTVVLGVDNNLSAGSLVIGKTEGEVVLDVRFSDQSLSSEITSDNITAEEAKELLTHIEGDNIALTTHVNEGLVTPEFVVDEYNNVHYAPTNTLMQSTLELASSAPLALNRIMMNDVRKRLGDIRTTNGTHGAWARYDGGKLSGEAGLENDFRTVQVGIDTVPTADSARMGVAFSYTDSDAEYARGSADMKAYSLAMYATKMFDNGMFVDVIGRMGTADTDLMVDGEHKASMDNVALSLSGEMGWRFDLNNMVYVEPQAEVTYTYVNDDKVSVSTANYDIDAVNSLMGRVGFAAGLKCPSDFGNVYVRASAVHEFLGDAKITGVNGDKSNTYEIDGQDTWVEYGIGANFNVTKSTYVWADVERTTGGALDEDWRATVGVRYAW